MCVCNGWNEKLLDGLAKKLGIIVSESTLPETFVYNDGPEVVASVFFQFHVRREKESSLLITKFANCIIKNGLK